jgi:hypothetical protein
MRRLFLRAELVAHLPGRFSYLLLLTNESIMRVQNGLEQTLLNFLFSCSKLEN